MRKKKKTKKGWRKKVPRCLDYYYSLMKKSGILASRIKKEKIFDLVNNSFPEIASTHAKKKIRKEKK